MVGRELMRLLEVKMDGPRWHHGSRIGQEMARELGPEGGERLIAARKREGLELKGKSGLVLDQMTGPAPGPLPSQEAGPQELKI